MSIAPIPPVAAALASPDLLAAARPAPPATSFSQILMNGLETVNQRVVHADAMVRAFAVDDSVPLHQVTFALEEARLSVELMMQVRARLVESYQRMMEMQL